MLQGQWLLEAKQGLLCVHIWENKQIKEVLPALTLHKKGAFLSKLLPDTSTCWRIYYCNTGYKQRQN